MFTLKLVSRIPLVIFVMASLLAVTPFQAVHAAGLRYAKPAATGTGDCLSWANACSLQTALTSTLYGDEIWVAAGIHKPTTGTDRSATFLLKFGIAVYGGFAGTESNRADRNPTLNITTLSGDLNGNDNNYVSVDEPTRADNSYHVVTGAGAIGATLDGFTITAGNASGGSCPAGCSGGGMNNQNNNPTLTNIVFRFNSAEHGGGMENVTSSPVLNNVTFSGNVTLGAGGGMDNWNNSNPTLTNVIFSDNLATSSNGGGISNDYSSSPTLTNVVFNGNSARYLGGAMSNYNKSNPTLTDVTFIDNRSTDSGGGAMTNFDSSPTLTNVTFIGNSALQGRGGAMDNYSSSPGLTNVTFSDNRAGSYGGALYNEVKSTPVLTNVTFNGNSAYWGGAMVNWDSNATLTNLTFKDNSAVWGGAMYNLGIGHPQIRNTIFWDNTAPNVPQIYNKDATSALTVSQSVVQGGCPVRSVCKDLITADPMLGTLGDYGGLTQTIPLLELSSAIDTGNDALCPAIDQRGLARPQGPHCDIGAYEATDVLVLPPLVTASVRADANPTSAALVDFIVAFSEPVTGVDPTDFALATSSRIAGATVTGVNGGPMAYTVTVATGSGCGTIRLDVLDDDTILDAAAMPLGGPGTGNGGFTTGQAFAIRPLVRTFFSQAAYDGWVLESSENSNKGGTLNATANTFILGDDASNRQYRAFLSFSIAALPDNSVIHSALFKIKQSGRSVGIDPFGPLGTLWIDLRQGSFGAAPLQLTDFNASASARKVAYLFPAPVAGWYSVALNDTAIGNLNKTGLTQFRLYFDRDDNNNHKADFMKFLSGNAAGSKPQLVITYTLP